MPPRIHHQRITTSAATTSMLVLLLLLLFAPKDVRASMTCILLKGTGSNCVSVEPLPSSKLNVQCHLPDLKLKDKECNILGEDEPINEEGMDESEAALLQRQREVANLASAHQFF